MTSGEQVEEGGPPIGRFAHDWNKCDSHCFVWTTYSLTAIVSGGIAYSFFDSVRDVKFYPLIIAGIFDLAWTLLIWVSAIVVNNSSMYDAYWSVYSPLAFWFWWYIADVDGKDVPMVRSILVGVSIWVWAVRLTWNWSYDWPGLHHEDFRYVRIRQTIVGKGFGRWVFWLTGSLGGIMLFPTIQVYFGTLPAFFPLYQGIVTDGANDVNALDYIASIVCVGAATLQYVADRQMRTFRRNKTDPSQLMESGLWRYSRHPNYFGEISFWFGIYLHALATDLRYWWSIGGFVSITVMFVFGKSFMYYCVYEIARPISNFDSITASIPLMESKMLGKRPHYQHTIDTTSMLIPWFRFPEKESTPPLSPSTTDI